MKRTPIPKYRQQREKSGKDRAFVVLDGRRIHLGEYDTPDSRERYGRAIAEWQAGSAAPVATARGLTVTELVSQFWAYAERYYAEPNRDRTSELELFRLVSRPLVQLYGSTPCAEFGPRRFKAVRQTMIDRNLSRGYINRQCNRLRRIFAWGCEEELLPGTVIHALRAVPGLRRGTKEVREGPGVKPVRDSDVDAVLPFLTPTLRAMVELQRLTGMRPAELVAMRTADIDVSGDPWTYTPGAHKTERYGYERRIYIGPEGQRILKPLLRAELSAFIFDPRDSVCERQERMRQARTTPLSCGNRAGTNVKPKPKRTPGDRYTPTSYARAIARACERARVDKWSPNRLRHSFATRVRREFGVDTAGTLLGHASASTITATYAERDQARAMEVAKRIG